MVLQGPQGRDDDHGRGPDPGGAALDVEELLGSEVGTESGFRDDPVPSASPAFVASRLLQPWAMFANGPPWMKAGECSKVCTRFGARALRNSAVIAPAAPMSATVIGSRPYCGRARSVPTVL